MGGAFKGENTGQRSPFVVHRPKNTHKVGIGQRSPFVVHRSSFDCADQGFVAILGHARLLVSMIRHAFELDFKALHSSMPKAVIVREGACTSIKSPLFSYIFPLFSYFFKLNRVVVRWDHHFSQGPLHAAVTLTSGSQLFSVWFLKGGSLGHLLYRQLDPLNVCVCVSDPSFIV